MPRVLYYALFENSGIKEEQVAQTRRIGHFIETGIAGGAEQVMIDLARFTETHSENFSPVILHFGHPWIAEQCERYRIDQLIVPFSYAFKSTLRLPVFAFQFSRWLKTHGIELRHSHLFGPVTGAAPACFLAGIPHVGTLHDVYMIEEKPARIFLVKLAAILGTRLVTVSKDMERFYSGRANFPNGSLRTIYNGIDSEQLVLNPPANNGNVDLATDGNSVTITCIGRLVELKRVDLIIEAVQTLAAHHTVRLLVIGEGPERENLERLAGQELNQSVFFLGARQDVAQWLRRSDIFVQYSSTEGLSRSILEAIALGLPAVVSDVGGNREIVLHQQNGFVVPASNPQELTKALEILVQDGRMRSGFGIRGQQHALTEFSREANNQLYLSLYEKLAG